MTDQAPTYRDPKMFAAQPLHKAMGLELEESRANYCRIRMTQSDFTKGGIGGSVHGGLLAALIDIASLEALIATHDNNPSSTPAGTADLSITYMRPALSPQIVAEAHVLRMGRQMAVTEVVISDDQGKMCAKGRTLYSFRPKGA